MILYNNYGGLYWNIHCMQVSCVSSSVALANRVQYPSYFQVLSPDANLADGFLAIIKQFGWRKVALIVQDENLLTVVNLSIILILQTATAPGKLIMRIPPPPPPPPEKVPLRTDFNTVTQLLFMSICSLISRLLSLLQCMIHFSVCNILSILEGTWGQSYIIL